MTQKVRFIHAADIHLGKTLYGIKQRYYDFFTAFEYLLKKAAFEKVDFILISGDLIDSERKVDPTSLGNIIKEIQEFKALCKNKLKREIPIICIEGNHETPFFSENTWLKLLAELELIILLSGEYDNQNNRINFSDYSHRLHKGGMIKIKNTEIYGISYFGSSTPDLYPLIKKEIGETNDFVILMMHFGIQGQDERKKGYQLTKDLQELHKKVDYLALGHFHKQYQLPERDPWIFNPGSLEVNEITEYATEHGVFLVDIFPEENNSFEVKSIFCVNGNPEPDDYNSIPNRKFLSFSSIDISESKSFEEAQIKIIDKLRKLGVPEKADSAPILSNLNVPVLYLSIKGKIGYSELDINLAELRSRIFNTFEILGLKINNHIFSKMGGEIDMDEEWSFDKIEEEALLATIENEEIFRAYKEDISHFVLNQLKGKLTKNADYNVIKSNINNWFNLHQNILKEIKRIVKTQKKPKSLKKKKSKKITKKSKQSSIDKAWQEEDFSKEFEDIKHLLDIDDESDEEFDIDDIIDDGDLNT